MLLTIGALVVVLGVLIFVHEAGHFVAAKAMGIQVLRFSLGFGRPVVRARWGETEYAISWLPVGGYVKMAGLEDEGVVGELEGGQGVVAVDPARAFDTKPVWKRMIVILAGVTMNVVLAAALFTGMGAIFGQQHLGMTPLDSVASAGLPPGARALATLRRGDLILRVNGDSARDWDQLQDAIRSGPSVLRLEIAGRDSVVVVSLPNDSAERRLIAEAPAPLLSPEIESVVPGLPAQRAGLKPGDLLIRLNGDTVRSWGQMVGVVRRSAGQPLTMTVLRAGQLVTVRLAPEPQSLPGDGGGAAERVEMIGVKGVTPTVYESEPLPRAFADGLAETWSGIVVVVENLRELVLGQVSLRDLGGPLTIGQLSGQAVRMGMFAFLNFIAFLSINLAVLNLLPIPILDGGQVVFLVAEAVRRRPLSIELRARLTQIGFVVLVGIMALALRNDVQRVFPHAFSR